MVVDASVLVAAALDSGPEGRWAEEVLAQEPLVAPELALVEASNIFRRLERAKVISRAEATAAQHSILDLGIELIPYAPVADRVWELRHNVTAYDAFYVAAAEALDDVLATLDVSLSRAKGPRCRFVLPAVS